MSRKSIWKEKKGGRYSLHFLLIELVKTVHVENVLLIMYAFYSIYPWVLRCGFISSTNRKMKGLQNGQLWAQKIKYSVIQKGFEITLLESSVQ